MAVTSYWYGNALLQAVGSGTAANNPNIDYLSDTINVMLCTNLYTPSATAHVFKSDVTNEVTGTGYTAGGQALTTKTLAYTAANSWATAWAATTVYTVGQIIRPGTGNGHLYRCVVAGTSGATTPTFPTVAGQTVADSGATWAEAGLGIIQFGAASVAWASSTITARYAVIYDATPATDPARPLLGYVDFGADTTSTSGTFTITWNSLGVLTITPS